MTFKMHLVIRIELIRIKTSNSKILHHHRLIIFCLLYLPVHREMPDAMWAPFLRCFIKVVQIFCLNGADLASNGKDDECYGFNALLNCR